MEGRQGSGLQLDRMKKETGLGKGWKGMRKATHVCSMEAGASLDHDPWSRLGNSKYHLCKASMSPGRAQALSNQKYSELAREFGPTEVCLLTGDTIIGTPLTRVGAARYAPMR